MYAIMRDSIQQNIWMITKHIWIMARTDRGYISSCQAGSNTEIGNIIQAYMAGSVNKDQALTQLDESNKELLNP